MKIFQIYDKRVISTTKIKVDELFSFIIPVSVLAGLNSFLLVFCFLFLRRYRNV